MRGVLLVALVLGGAARADTVVLVSDPAALHALEAGGLGFAERLGEASRRVIAEAIAGDLAGMARADPAAGVGVARHSHRLFDARWLGASWTRFELIGVGNRLDRRPFVDGACGETRLVYRLAYARAESASRLPMTVTVDYRAAEDCADAARRWQPPAGAQGEALARWLLSDDGPLAPRLRDRLAQVQVNLQAVRWPSAVRPDMAAHAEYLLRAFRPGPDGTLAASRLDNTPDLARLARDAALRAELVAWIGAHLDEIDAGTAVLPDRFLAERALSISPRGLARRANRPFTALLPVRQIQGLALDGRRTIASPAALLRRLDDATCVGCHQARAVAGFHFLGEEPAGVDAVNALAVPGSPHLAAELTRRRALTETLARGEAGSFFRPFSERGDDDAGGYGAHCGLGDPAFARWTCAAGLSCRPYDAPTDEGSVGVCLPASPSTGDPCEVGRIRPSADPRRDTVARPRRSTCRGDAVCNRNAVGFPGGMCTPSCDELDGDAVCGKIAVLRGFNDCLARRTPFARCLAENVTPAGLRACDQAHPCRDDYLCARAGAGGACIPPYFLFQMRVDGHP